MPKASTSDDGDDVDSVANGWLLQCSDEWSPVIIDAATKSDYPTREAFHKAIEARDVKSESGRLTYTALGGDRFVFLTDQTELPRVNDVPVILAPARVYDSPFVQSDWRSGVVTIQKGNRKLVLNFNE